MTDRKNCYYADDATAVRERPILFSGPMVRAILDGRKTQTRRVAKITEHGFLRLSLNRGAVMDERGPCWRPYAGAELQPMPAHELAAVSPYGQPGDRLWVRETFFQEARLGRDITDEYYTIWQRGELAYAADGTEYRDLEGGRFMAKRPGIHMPRWASRLTLEITGVRVERLQDIREGDVLAEGCHFPLAGEFATLWDSIAKPGEHWDANPWVWVITFRRADA